MNNNDKFTLDYYKSLMRGALEMGFMFQTFSAYLGCPASRVVLLRHDVDVSLQYALQIAEVEKELDIRSTFFVRTQSDFYNLLEESNILRLSKLIEWGFEIGLHQELWKFTDDIKKAARLLRCQRLLVEETFGIQLKGVATHLPKKNTIHMDAQFLAEAGFEYRPGSDIFNKDSLFVSDSNKQWKTYSLAEALTRADKIIACVHPVWWAGNIADPACLIRSLAEGR